MSEPAIHQRRDEIPPWTLGWRLQRSLSWAGMTTEAMADELGVARSTVSRWCNDKGRPTRGYLKLWALRTGVPLDWLIGDADGSNRIVLMHDPPGTREIAAGAKPIADPDTVAALRRSLGYTTRTGRRADSRGA